MLGPNEHAPLGLARNLGDSWCAQRQLPSYEREKHIAKTW